MPIPNEDQVGTYLDQSELDTGDWAMLENVHQGFSVLSGGAVTAQGSPNGTVAVAAGVAKVGHVAVSITAGNVSVISGSANPDGTTATAADAALARFSLVTVNSSGQLGVLHGTPAGLAPTNDGSYLSAFPTFAGKTILASVWVPPTSTTVTTAQIGDKRELKSDGDFIARAITPTALSAAANDYAPTGLSTANVIRQATNSTTQRNISGIVPTGFLDGRTLYLHNLGPGPLALLDQSTSSLAANRLSLANDIVLPVDRSVALLYDVTSARWRAVGAQTAAGANTLALGTAATPGTSNYYVRSDDTILAFDVTVPANLGTAAVGSATVAARRDHVHPDDKQITFAKSGAVAASIGVLRWYNDSGRTLTFVSTRASVGTAPTGATLIVDVNKDGTTIFTTQASRPTIAIAANTATGAAPDVTTIASGSYLTVDVDQVGSTVAGADLTVQITMRG